MSPLVDCHALECEPVPSSVRSARLFVVDKLQEWRYDELVDSAALMTSELATNAIIHTDHPYRVSVSRSDRRIRVEVFDSVGILPEVPPRDLMLPDDAGPLFSGLGLVDRIAADWGSELVQGGKVVWFEVAATDGEHRQLTSDLAALRSPAPDDEIAVWDDGEEEGGPPHHQEAPVMAKHTVIDSRDDLDDRRVVYEERRRGGIGRWLLVLLVIAALAIGAFFLLGGSADVDTKGDLEVPEVDVDVNAPDVNVDSEEAPPASADADADADASNG
jgi:anti-sigma regulatory factor (Ser/Thr protein kinase)